MLNALYEGRKVVFANVICRTNTVCFSLFQRLTAINLEPSGYVEQRQQVSGSTRCLPTSNCQNFIANRTCSVCALFSPSIEIAIHYKNAAESETLVLYQRGGDWGGRVIYNFI